MPVFLAKQQADILRNALTKLSNTTPVSAVAPGAVARSLAEVFAQELGDMYSIMDFNMSQAFLSTASGRSLDLLGALYNVTRKTLSNTAAADETVGAFNFYLDSPAVQEIVIPEGTQVTTDSTTFVGQQYVYTTVAVARIPIGRLRSFVGIRPAFVDSVFTAGANTLTRHSYTPPPGITVRCTNAKAIAAEVGYEADDAYRARLIKAVRTSAGGTAEALRFTTLSVPGVRDAQVRTAPFGLGSFEVVITPENNALSATIQIAAAEALEKIRPVGVRMYIKTPQYVTVEMSFTVMVKDVLGVVKSDIARRAELAAVRYMNTLLSGQGLVYNQLLQALLDSSDMVTDVIMRSFRINGAEALRRNFSVEEDQQLIPGSIVAAYA